MYDFVMFDNWRSDLESDLHVLNWSIPVSAQMRKNRYFMAGNMCAIEDARPQYTEMEIEITMAIVGQELSALLERFRIIKTKIHNAKCIKLSDMSAYFFKGYVQRIENTEENANWIQFKVIFSCNPPCAMRVLNQIDFMPSDDKPIAAQITDTNASVKTALTAAGTISLFESAACYRPEINIRLTGTWDSLNIGGLILPQKTDSAIYYIDVLRGKCFTYGTKAYPVEGVSGTYENIGKEPVLNIGGVNLAAEISIMIIERS